MGKIKGHITADDEGTHCHCSKSISLLIIAPTIFEPPLSTQEKENLQKCGRGWRMCDEEDIGDK